jgi:hypothetical protein
MIAVNILALQTNLLNSYLTGNPRLAYYIYTFPIKSSLTRPFPSYLPFPYRLRISSAWPLDRIYEYNGSMVI